jgi:hypothetical protein
LRMDPFFLSVTVRVAVDYDLCTALSQALALFTSCPPILWL